MSGFLERLASRATGTEAVVSLRRPSRFESAPPASAGFELPARPANDGRSRVPDPPWDPAAHEPAAVRGLSSPGRVEPEPEKVTPRPVHESRAAHAQGAPGPAAHGEGALADTRQRTLPGPAAHADDTGPAADAGDAGHEPARPAAVPPGLQPGRGRTAAARILAAEESEEATAVPAGRSYRPRAGLSLPLPLSLSLPLPPGRDSDDGQGSTAAAEAAAAEPDPIALIRTFLVQRLVDEQVLAQDERIEVRTTDDPGKPADPSSTGLVVPPARRFRTEVAAGRAGAPEVHLHIDRIEVIRPTVSRPAPPRRNAPPVDHEAYLARRRAERR